ncbi:hypothetical protein [Geminocystis herdmanii]|uniref:hypothetical protein n=1 Tax=Geminocystis herdmanii TaxID=669359 RepID=UPI001181AA0B|nr:hypothetical protein [Geminocystis herdmanii]
MFKPLLISTLIFAGGNLLPVMAEAQRSAPVTENTTPETTTTENPPAETFQPGFWQPIARVDMTKPITLKIINDSGILLDYALTDADIEPLRLEEGATRSIENVEAPIYVVIYPDIKNPNSSRISLKYFVEVTPDNVVELTVKQIESISQGNRTFNLQSSGAIFLY